MHLRSVLPCELQDDLRPRRVPRQHARRVVHLPVDDDPAALACVVLLHLRVRDIAWRLAARVRYRRVVECDGLEICVRELERVSVDWSERVKQATHVSTDECATRDYSSHQRAEWRFMRRLRRCSAYACAYSATYTRIESPARRPRKHRSLHISL